MSDNASHDGDTAVKNRRPSLIAYQVRDGKDDQSYWDRVGVAWSNRDGGFTVQLHAMPPAGRNSIWFMFTVPREHNPIVNFDEQAPESVAVFRYRYSQHLGDPEWQDFVDRLCAASPLFARLWATHDVAPPRPAVSTTCSQLFSEA